MPTDNLSLTIRLPRRTKYRLECYRIRAAEPSLSSAARGLLEAGLTEHEAVVGTSCERCKHRVTTCAVNQVPLQDGISCRRSEPKEKGAAE